MKCAVSVTFFIFLFIQAIQLDAQCNLTIQHANADDQCLYAIEDVVWQNLVNASAVAPGYSVIVSGTNNEVFDAGALSINTVKNNGWATTVIDETNTERIFGLSNAPSATPGFSRAQFGIYFMSNGAFRVYESGNYRYGDGTYAQNDIFKIAVEQSVVKYYKNGVLFYTSAVTPTLPLRVDVTLKRKNTATPVISIREVKVYNGSDGSFSASVTGAGAGTGASYQWFLNSAPVGTNSSTYTNASISSTDVLTCEVTSGSGGCAGLGTVLTSNSVAFTSQSASTFGTYYALNDGAESACLSAQEDAVFTSLVNVTATGNDLIKDKGTSGLNDASAFSINKVVNNGYAQATITEVATLRAFGLSAVNSGLAYTTIQFAFLIRGDGTLDIYESGTFRTGNVASYASGTILKISVESNVVKYYVNGALKYVSTVTPTLPLYVDAAFNTINSTLSDVIIVNGASGSFTASGSPLGASPVYDWKLNGVSTGVTSSTYTNTGLLDTDQLSCSVNSGLTGCAALDVQTFQFDPVSSFTGTFYISGNIASATCAETREEVTFTNLVNATATNNDIQKFGPTIVESYNGGAISLNKVYNNGGAEMTISQLGTYRAFGLSNVNSDASNTSILYGIELRADNLLHVFEGSTDRGSYTSFTTGDVVKVIVENNVVKYYLNSTLLYTSGIAPTLPLVVDVSLYNRSPASSIDDVFVTNGSSAVFAANVSDAGTTPTYQWKLNGTNVGIGTSYTNLFLSSSDVITCKMKPDLAGCSLTEYESNDIIVLAAGGASSPSTTWNGSVSTDWFNGSNWSNGTPKGYTKVLIPVTGSGRYPTLTSSEGASVYDLSISSGAQFTISGTSTLTLFNDWTNNGTFTSNSSTLNVRSCTNNDNQIITSASESFYNVSIDNVNGVELQGEHHVVGQATMTNGIIDYLNSSSILIFDDNSTATGASSLCFVNGKVRKDGNDAFSFPIGKGTIFRPLTITAPSVSDQFTAEYFYSSSLSVGSTFDTGLNRTSGCEHWSLTHPNAATFRVTLPWDSNDCPPSATYVTDLTALRVAAWDATKWVDVGQSAVSGPVTQGTVTSSNTTRTGYFTIGSSSSSNVLPVELAELKASANASAIEISWKTFIEKNSAVFEIQRADSTLYFVTIGQVNAAGSSQETIEYSYSDQSPLKGMNYYRLKAIDLDGEFRYSKIVADRFERRASLVLFPNPVKRGETVKFFSDHKITIVDPVNLIARPDVVGDSSIETGDLVPGIYLLIDESSNYYRLVVY